jgi:hypothetical protein
MIDRAFRRTTDGDYPVHCDAACTPIEDEIARHVQDLVDGVALWPRHKAIIDEIVYYCQGAVIRTHTAITHPKGRELR